MDYLFSAVGTMGDLRPALAVAERLRERGHEVAVNTHTIYGSTVERAGLRFIDLNDEEAHRRLFSDPRMYHPTQSGKLICDSFLDRARVQYEAIAEHAVPGRTVVAGWGTALGARLAHDKLGVPLATLHIAPSMIISAVDPPVFSYFRFPSWHVPALTRRILRLGDSLFADPITAPRLNQMRADLGLAPVRHVWLEWQHSPQLILGLFPEWFAPRPRDWPAHLKLTGFPMPPRDDTAELPEAAREFLEAGAPPVVFSTTTEGPTNPEFTAAAVEACRLSGRRGIILTRRDEEIPPNLPDSVRHFNFLPHRALLPRAAAVVAHGGIGSIAAALEAGVPQLLIPRTCDQFDNANRIVRLGVGRALKARHAAGKRLAYELDLLLNSGETAKRCAVYARRMAEYDGADAACDELEKFAAQVYNH